MKKKSVKTEEKASWTRHLSVGTRYEIRQRFDGKIRHVELLDNSQHIEALPPSLAEGGLPRLSRERRLSRPSFFIGCRCQTDNTSTYRFSFCQVTFKNSTCRIFWPMTTFKSSTKGRVELKKLDDRRNRLYVQSPIGSNKA